MAVPIIMGEGRYYNRGYFRRVKTLLFPHCTLGAAVIPKKVDLRNEVGKYFLHYT